MASTVTVVFNSNGGEGVMPSITRYQGDWFILPINQFEQEDYRFIGWSLTSDGDVQIEDGQKVQFSVGIDEPITVDLYAVWLSLESETLSSTLVSDMYNFSRKNNIKMLSDFGVDGETLFWNEYRDKYKKYDKLFNRMFNSFRYFMQEKGQNIGEITSDFIDDVYNHLMVNAKKYEELYRINVIQDDDYSITDNYNITEELAKENTVYDIDTKGARTDSTASTIGAKETVNTREYGEHETDIEFTKGSQTDSQTDDIAGFNSSTYSDDRQRENVYGSREDSNTTTSKEHEDTETIDEGARSNSESFVKGEQIDSLQGTRNEDYTLTRKGNIGVRTITEVIEYHRDFWNTYEFYTYIFKEICAELLLI